MGIACWEEGGAKEHYYKKEELVGKEG